MYNQRDAKERPSSQGTKIYEDTLLESHNIRSLRECPLRSRSTFDAFKTFHDILQHFSAVQSLDQAEDHLYR